jgi:hypothetical protein
MGGGSGGGGTTTTQVQYSPTEQAFRDKIMNAAGGIYDQTSGQGGPPVAGFSAPTIAGQGMAEQAAANQNQIAGQMAGGATTGLRDILGMTGQNYAQNYGNLAQAKSFLDVNNNPYLAAAAGSAAQQINQNLQRNILPSVNATAIDTGGYGGSRQGVAQGLAMSDANLQASNAINKMYSDAYTTGVGAFGTGVQNFNAGNQVANTGMADYSQLLSELPATSALQTGGAATMSGVGAQQENLTQQQLNSQYYGQWAPLQNLANIIYGGSNGTTTSTSSGQSGGGSALRSGLSGAASGAAMGSAFGPWGTAIGGIGGGLYGLLNR